MASQIFVHSMSIQRSPQGLTLYIDPWGTRTVAAFIMGIGIIILFSIRVENLAPIFPALFFIFIGLLLLREYGGATIVHCDQQLEQLSIYYQKFGGAKTVTWEIPLADVLDLCVEQRSSYDEERIISDYYYLVIQVKDGYLPITRSGVSGEKKKQKLKAIAQEIRHFLDLE